MIDTLVVSGLLWVEKLRHADDHDEEVLVRNLFLENSRGPGVVPARISATALFNLHCRARSRLLRAPSDNGSC